MVGVNTLMAPKSEYSGMNFALASTEIDKLVRSKFAVQLDANSAAAETGLVSLISSPSGADVEVDGVFLGSTPAELPLAAGERSLRITKKGFSPFERKATRDCRRQAEYFCANGTREQIGLRMDLLKRETG